MSDVTDKLPPVPQHDPPIDTNGVLNRFTASWLRWFIQLKAKVDVINDSVTGLSQLVGDGLAGKDENGEWKAVVIEGTLGRISVTNGDGVAGDPKINISPAFVADISEGGTGATTASGARQNLGAASAITSTATTATAGTAELPASPVGFAIVSVNGVNKKIPYYD